MAPDRAARLGIGRTFQIVNRAQLDRAGNLMLGVSCTRAAIRCAQEAAKILDFLQMSHLPTFPPVDLPWPL